MAVEPFLTPEEVSTQLKVHVNTIYRLLRDKQLKGIRVGALWRIPQSEVIKYLNRGEG